jgi:vacuolar-type H+-ATPase subunit H
MSSEKIASLIDQAVQKAKVDNEFAAALKADPQKTVKENFNYVLSDTEADEFIEGVMRELLEEMIEQRRASSDSDKEDPLGDALKTAFNATVDGASALYKQARPLAENAYDRANESRKRTVDAMHDAHERAIDELEQTYSKAKPIVDEAVSEAVGVAESTYQKVKPVVREAMDNAVSDVENAYHKTRPVVEDVTERATARAEDVYRKARPFMRDAAERVHKDLDTILSRDKHTNGAPAEEPIDVETHETTDDND